MSNSDENDKITSNPLIWLDAQYLRIETFESQGIAAEVLAEFMREGPKKKGEQNSSPPARFRGFLGGGFGGFSVPQNEDFMEDRVLAYQYLGQIFSVLHDVETLLLSIVQDTNAHELLALKMLRGSFYSISIDGAWQDVQRLMTDDQTRINRTIIKQKIESSVQFSYISRSELLAMAKELLDSLEACDIDDATRDYLRELVNALVAALNDINRKGFTDVQKQVQIICGKLVLHGNLARVAKADRFTFDKWVKLLDVLSRLGQLTVVATTAALPSIPSEPNPQVGNDVQEIVASDVIDVEHKKLLLDSPSSTKHPE